MSTATKARNDMAQMKRKRGMKKNLKQHRLHKFDPAKHLFRDRKFTPGKNGKASMMTIYADEAKTAKGIMLGSDYRGTLPKFAYDIHDQSGKPYLTVAVEDADEEKYLSEQDNFFIELAARENWMDLEEDEDEEELKKSPEERAKNRWKELVKHHRRTYSSQLYYSKYKEDCDKGKKGTRKVKDDGTPWAPTFKNQVPTDTTNNVNESKVKIVDVHNKPVAVNTLAFRTRSHLGWELRSFWKTSKGWGVSRRFRALKVEPSAEDEGFHDEYDFLSSDDEDAAGADGTQPGVLGTDAPKRDTLASASASEPQHQNKKIKADSAEKKPLFQKKEKKGKRRN